MNESPVDNRYNKALYITIAIYFFWGFSASANTLLIPLVKETFNLLQWQSQLIEFSFYAAYFSGSLFYIVASDKCQQLMTKFSTKRLIIVGLLISVLGTLLLILALSLISFALILLSLFIIALGFSLQQIAANPTLVHLGGELYGAHRLTIAGALGSLGNMVAPMLLGSFAFSSTVTEMNNGFVGGELLALSPVYYGLVVGYLLFAVSYFLIAMPNLQEQNGSAGRLRELLKSRNFLLGATALFFYVGGEVTIQSNLPELLKNADFMGLSTAETVQYISLFGGALFIGRCSAALFNFSLSGSVLKWGLMLMPLIAFSITLGLMSLGGIDITHLLSFLPFLLILSLSLLISGAQPERLLLTSACCATGLILVALLLKGQYAAYCLLAVALFSAVMWPCIFALALAGLGNKAQVASSVLVMMILGGALIPPLQGYLSDISSIGIHYSYCLPLCCYAVVAYYGHACHGMSLGQNSPCAETAVV